MCGETGSTANQGAACATWPIKPEQRIADIISKEAGIHMDPLILKLIIKYNWRELAKAAHEIHDGY